MPKTLSSKAKSEWRKLIRRGNFTALQSDLMAEYCEVLVDLRTATEKARENPVYQGPNGAMCSSPWAKQRDSLIVRFNQLCKTLKIDKEPDHEDRKEGAPSVADFIKLGQRRG